MTMRKGVETRMRRLIEWTAAIMGVMVGLVVSTLSSIVGICSFKVLNLMLNFQIVINYKPVCLSLMGATAHELIIVF